jgi:hypothetical protein
LSGQVNDQQPRATPQVDGLALGHHGRGPTGDIPAQQAHLGHLGYPIKAGGDIRIVQALLTGNPPIGALAVAPPPGHNGAEANACP